jgi:hypothetical protein
VTILELLAPVRQAIQVRRIVCMPFGERTRAFDQVAFFFSFRTPLNLVLLFLSHMRDLLLALSQ